MGSLTDFTNHEKEYIEEIKICLSEDSEIGKVSRRLLEKLRLELSISENRASEIESFILTTDHYEEASNFETNDCIKELIYYIKSSDDLNEEGRRFYLEYLVNNRENVIKMIGLFKIILKCIDKKPSD